MSDECAEDSVVEEIPEADINEQEWDQAIADLDKEMASQKGSDFEQWAHKHVFDEKGTRLTLYVEDNLHLDKYGDGVGITNDEYRILDKYYEGEIWELKSGYEQGAIDAEQAYEYSLMAEAGFVNVRNEQNQLVSMPVSSINYLFETQEGAKANYNNVYGAAVWYIDETNNVQLFQR